MWRISSEQERSCKSALDVQENGAIGRAAHDERGEAPRNVPRGAHLKVLLILLVVANGDLKFRSELKARGRPKRSAVMFIQQEQCR